jgi:hypothetical protein
VRVGCHRGAVAKELYILLAIVKLVVGDNQTDGCIVERLELGLTEPSVEARDGDVHGFLEVFCQVLLGAVDELNANVFIEVDVIDEVSESPPSSLELLDRWVMQELSNLGRYSRINLRD